MDRELWSRVKYISGENRSVLFDIPAEGRGEFLTTAQISDVLVREGEYQASDEPATVRNDIAKTGIQVCYTGQPQLSHTRMDCISAG